MTKPDDLVEHVAEEIRKIYYDDAPIVESPSKDAARCRTHTGASRKAFRLLVF
jgi:hypothetical protein